MRGAGKYDSQRRVLSVDQPVSVLLTVEFFQFLPDSLPFDGRQVIYEKLAVEVVNFVLDTDSQQTFRLKHVGLPLPVERAQTNMFRTLDGFIKTGH